MSIQRYRRRGIFAGVAGGLANAYFRNPRYFDSVGRHARGYLATSVNNAARSIGSWWRNRGASSRQSGRNVRRRLNSTGNGGGAASSNGTTVRRSSRRASAYRRGSGRSKMYGRRRKGRRRRRGGSGVSTLMKMFTTPQVTKVTTANAYDGIGFGVRTFVGLVVNSKADLNDMWNRRPVGLLQLTGGALGLGGETNKCVCHKFWNKFILQNRANWDMELKVYECIVRRNKGFTPSETLITDWVLARFQGDDTRAENQDKNQPGYGINEFLGSVERNPGYTPYMSSSFCNTMRIIKTTSMKIAMNDYVSYYVTCGKKSFSGSDLLGQDDAGFDEMVAGWTKMLLFSWVGGPIDNELIGATGLQSKATCDLFVQRERENRFYFPVRAALKYNIASSNATTDQLGFEAINRYTTRNNVTAGAFRAPATVVVEAAAAGEDDVIQQDADDL